MSWPALCPVCDGWGKVPKTYADFKTWVTGFKTEEPKDPVVCQGCGSKGWVEVESNWGNIYYPGTNAYPWNGKVNIQLQYGIGTPDNTSGTTPP